jgi:hypothetical protein
MKCDGTRAETRFRLLAKRTSPFKLTVGGAGRSVQSTPGRRAVHISLQGLYCSCKPVLTLTGYGLHSLVSPSLLLPCVIACHYISNAVYHFEHTDWCEMPFFERCSSAIRGTKFCTFVCVNILQDLNSESTSFAAPFICRIARDCVRLSLLIIRPLTVYKYGVYCMYHQVSRWFNILPARCIYMFWMILRTNRDYFLMQH